MDIKNNKILHITNNDFDGQGRAVLRLHNELLSLGIDSRVLVVHKKSKEEHVYSLSYSEAFKKSLIDFIKSFFYLNLNKSFQILRFLIFRVYSKCLILKYKPISLFNFDVQFTNINTLYVYLRSSDILFLHSVDEILSVDKLENIYKVFSLKIFYHILDIEPITGGCHFNFGCEKYLSNCKNCPQLKGDNKITNTILNMKKESLRRIPVHWIVPNNFAFDILKKSYVLSRPHTINVLFMGIESQRYKYISKNYARRKLKLPNMRTILFGCLNFSDKRKGAQILKKSLCDKSIINFKSDSAHLITFGELNGFSFKGISPKWTHLGSINTSEEMNMVYRASDLLASPSIDDIGPTIVQEAFMNHLPIVAFDIGVARDLVRNNINGKLVKCFSTEQFKVSLSNCLSKSYRLDYKNNKLLEYKKNCSTHSEAKGFLKLINSI